MSRIEDALNWATFVRSMKANNEKKPDSAAPPVISEAGINVLIISDDRRTSRLISQLRSLLKAEIFTTNDMVQGMKYFCDKHPVEIDDYELRFTASMLDYLCSSGGHSNTT